MVGESEEGNWLRAAHVACPHCNHPLYRVDHSPLADDWLLYCDKCANRAVVSYYDPVVTAIQHGMAEADRFEYSPLMAAIEQRLKPCNCGGHYRHDAARRCYNCLAEVITNGSSVDLWPSVYGMNPDERDPTAEEIAWVGQFEAEHVRRGDLWA